MFQGLGNMFGGMIPGMGGMAGMGQGALAWAAQSGMMVAAWQ